MFKFGDTGPGLHECVLDLDQLYLDPARRKTFERRWEAFESAHGNPTIFQKSGSRLAYLTESLMPTNADERTPVLLLLGNPAIHSVEAGLCFSFEGDGREHRFWVALRETGWLDFPGESGWRESDRAQRNKVRKEEFLNLRYLSPARIGLQVYYSFPTPASVPPWAGVAGVRRLFGRSLSLIERHERQRIADVAGVFLRHGGTIVAFQRDAYEAVRAPDCLGYSLSAALAADLRGPSAFRPDVPVFGLPPTRYFHTTAAREALRACLEEVRSQHRAVG